MKKRTLVAFLMVAVLLVSVFGCTAAPEQTDPSQTEGPGNAGEPVGDESKASGTLTMAYAYDISGIASWDIRDITDHVSLSCVYEPLFVLDNGNPVGYLAKDLVSNPDELYYEVILREDVTFSDGSKLDADALLWFFEHYKEVSPTSSTYFGSVDHFEKTGDYSVKICLTQWDSQIPFGLAYTAGMPYSKAAFEANGAEWATANAVGTGPYVMGDYVANDYRIYNINENYWNKEEAPVYEQVKWIVIADELTATSALQTGEIDGYLGASYSMLETLDALGFQCLNSPTMQVQSLVFASDVEGSPLSNLLVRQAICYAIDSESICEVITCGMGGLSTQSAIPGTAFYNEDVVGYEYNVEKAKELMAEAGYPDGFKTKLVTESASIYPQIATMIQANLAEIGIDLEIKLDERNLWFEEMYGIDEGMIVGRNSFDNDLCNNLLSNYSKASVGGVGLLNQCKIHPDDLDEAIRNSITATSMEEMYAYEKEAQKLLIDEYCIMYPVFTNARTFISLTPDINDNGCFGTVTGAFNYNLLTPNK